MDTNSYISNRLGFWYKGKYVSPIAGGDGTGNTAVLDQLVDALAARTKEREQQQLQGPFYRATPSTPSTPYYTGPGGLFGVPGLERDIISARITPMGLADRLPAVPTNVVQPLYAYLTGFQAGSGSEPVGVCDDPPTVGAGKSCIQTAQFGRFSRLTRTLEVNRLGAILNRGEMQDIAFLNEPLGGMGGITVPGNIPAAVRLRNEVVMRMIELGVEFQNWMSRAIYEGNPANNTGGDGYREFPGLDILVNTGKVDALTNTACPALDSDIKNFNYGLIGDGQETNNSNLLTVMSYLMRYLRYNAERMNFGDTRWVIVMRPELFWELTSIWPCVYMTWRCQTSGDNQAIVDAGDMIRMRDDMRNGSYLIVDGVRYDVIQDNNIREESNITGGSATLTPGMFASDIYVLPLTVRGGAPVLFWQYFDFSTSMDILSAGPLANNYFWSDGGRYLWHLRPPNNWCIQWLAKIEPRIILRTPQLAGRVTNVRYNPLQHTRDVRTTDPYFVNGGQSTARTVDTRYAEWSPVNTNGA